MYLNVSVAQRRPELQGLKALALMVECRHTVKNTISGGTIAEQFFHLWWWNAGIQSKVQSGGTIAEQFFHLWWWNAGIQSKVQSGGTMAEQFSLPLMVECRHQQSQVQSGGTMIGFPILLYNFLANIWWNDCSFVIFAVYFTNMVQCLQAEHSFFFNNYTQVV